MWLLAVVLAMGAVTEAYEDFSAMDAVDGAPDDDEFMDHFDRRLQEVHEGVPTDTQPLDAEVEADWAHDFDVLKQVLPRRGYDVRGASRLCELPAVYCAPGFRRRVPLYTANTMGDDWVGKTYQLILPIVNDTASVSYDPDIHTLRRVAFLQVLVRNGPMPPGIENLQHLSVLLLVGSQGGFDGGLPPNFWANRAKMFLMMTMGPQFTGRLEPVMPMCQHLTYRLYLYMLLGFSGNVEHLGACNRVTSVFDVFQVPLLTGNAWATALAWGHPVGRINFKAADFKGPMPYAEGPVPSPDPWASWCASGTGNTDIQLIQDVGGPFAAGFSFCEQRLSGLVLAGSRYTGPFPLNLANNTVMQPAALDLDGCGFSGPIPEVPSHMTTVKLQRNRWAGDLPASWYSTPGITELDFTDCGMVGPIVNITPFITTVLLSGNAFEGPAPESWRAASLEEIDLSGNRISGPPFLWGQAGSSPQAGWNMAEFAVSFVQPPAWPLTFIKLNNNPLGVHVEYLIFMMSYYELVELHASNCSLHGYPVGIDGFHPGTRSPNGGVVSFLGAKYAKLQVLDLSDNDILSFGYRGDGISPSTCTATFVSETLPLLRKFVLSGNKNLRRVHPALYTLDLLDVSGSDRLTWSSVQVSPADCDAVTGSASSECPGYLQEACLYLVPTYTAAGPSQLCAELGVIAGGSRSLVMVEPRVFAPDVLCRCIPGTELTDGACSPCPVDTYRSDQMSACTSCPRESSRSAGLGASAFDCSCSAGHFMSAEVCEKCPENTYSDTVGATSISACRKCPSGTVSSEGSDSILSCQCPPGAMPHPVHADVCDPCPFGSYKDSSGSLDCTRCPVTATGAQLTTLGVGTVHATGCLCPQGTFSPLRASGECWDCPEGMSCDAVNTSEAALAPGSGLPYPAAKSGFMTMVNDPMKPFKCEVTIGLCPGGPPGHCGLGRDSTSVGCAACPEGSFTDSDGQCRSCGEGTDIVWLFLVAALGLVLIFLLVFFVVDSRVTAVPRTTLTVLIIGAQLVTTAQTTGALKSLAVDWPQPLRGLLDVMGMLTFDLDVLRAECLLGQSRVRGYLVRQLVAPVGCTYLILLMLLKQYTRRRDPHFIRSTANALGTIYQTFFVSVLMTITLPFVCFKHPGDAGSSMLSDPDVLCFESAEHSAMMGIAVVSFLINVVPFLTLVTYGVWHYKQALASSSSKSLRHLAMFRFLFFRFNPSCYYYSSLLLLRSCLVCFLPTVTGDAPEFQVLLIGLLFLVSSHVQLQLQPWRSRLANHSDAWLSHMLVLLMLCVAMSTDFEEARSVVGIVGTVMMILIFALVLFLVGFTIYKKFVPTPYYHRFLCHHKGDAGTQARYLQLLLVQRSGDSCFIDSDDLKNLDDLLDIVRTRVGHLIVYLTGDTLRRVWCAGEVSTAFLSHRRALAVRTPSFVPPSAEEIGADKVQSFLRASDVSLVELGVSDDALAGALSWITSADMPTISYDLEVVGLKRFQGLCGSIISLTGWRLLSSRAPETADSMKVLKSKSDANSDEGVGTVALGSLVISTQRGSDEATAAAGILAMYTKAIVDGLTEHGITILANLPDQHSVDLMEVVRKAYAVLLVLSPGSLECREQQRVAAACAAGCSEAVPILTPDFRFPGPEFYDARSRAQGPQAAEAWRQLFKRIAVPLATHSSAQVLEAQCCDVVARLQRRPRSEPSSAAASPRAQGPAVASTGPAAGPGEHAEKPGELPAELESEEAGFDSEHSL